MKKHLPYLYLFLVLTAMFILINKDKYTETTKVITINTLHSYLYNNEQLIQIPIYVAGSNHTIYDLETYEQTYINNDQDIKIFLDLEEITFSHNEVYLNDTYTKYIIKFKMPNLTEDLTIKNASLNIIWINNEQSSFKIGDLYLKYLNDKTNNSIISLDSKSNIDSKSPQMDIIEVKLEHLINNDANIYISKDHLLDYHIEQEVLYITVPNLNLCANYLPLWIKYDDQILSINNYHYIIDYNLLEKAGKLINIYAFD